MSRGVRGKAAFTTASITVIAAALAGCGAADIPRTVLSESIYGPPSQSDWLEIDGSWQVVATDGANGALLQPAIEFQSDPTPRAAASARWIDVRTGETIWERDDFGSMQYNSDDILIMSTGSGGSSAIESIDLATGQSLWSVPESDLGECTGWRAVEVWTPADEAASDDASATDEASATATDGSSESGTSEATDSQMQAADEIVGANDRLVLAGPQSQCRTAERTLLTEMNVSTGELTPVLRGRGTLLTQTDEQTLTTVAWTSDDVVLTSYDAAGVQLAATAIPAANFVAGYNLPGLVAEATLELDQRTADTLWLQSMWVEDSRITLNTFVVDPVAGTAMAADFDCIPVGGEGSWFFTTAYRSEPSEFRWCAVSLVGSGQITVSTDLGDGTSWSAPTADSADAWTVSRCRANVADVQDDTYLALGTTPEAAVTAFDLFTGEELWRYGGAGSAVLQSRPDADAAIVLSQTGDGLQTLATIDLCTGEVRSSAEVAGASIADQSAVSGSITSRGSVVTVPTAETTYLTVFRARGAEPEPQPEESPTA